ncbi:hypothetical protein GIB67_001884 [Kingdonia uniflora]|uniref:Uncharacterized protein n=1 Tax=Kingdonia uniflora TaxID=39325 RepID=A0A7J7LQF3_9MAGN|nr:hypothetical protein GIB67_001884 [Kingdonia uniflora]
MMVGSYSDDRSISRPPFVLAGIICGRNGGAGATEDMSTEKRPDDKLGLLVAPTLGPTSFGVLLPWVFGHDAKKILLKYLRTAHLFALVIDQESGEVKQEARLCYKLDPSDKENLKTVKHKLRVIAPINFYSWIHPFPKVIGLNINGCMEDQSIRAIKHPDLTVTSDKRILDTILLWGAHSNRLCEWLAVDAYVISSTPDLLYGDRRPLLLGLGSRIRKIVHGGCLTLAKIIRVVSELYYSKASLTRIRELEAFISRFMPPFKIWTRPNLNSFFRIFTSCGLVDAILKILLMIFPRATVLSSLNISYGSIQLSGVAPEGFYRILVDEVIRDDVQLFMEDGTLDDISSGREATGFCDIVKVVVERDRLGCQLFKMGYIKAKVTTIMADTYVEGEEDEDDVVGVVGGLDGVSPQTEHENKGDDNMNPENENEKVE